ncbi:MULTISPECIES: ankyrin repeat domain-containing protein [Rhizobium]|uniref:Ankyrin repeat domain-containing protein n=1 Tax=Rhizobium tropici TaxID=398 RepID=A0A6P1C4A9_RHITR|nr:MULTISPECIES: ankyrin repeat domain-containing protein [Rhizobium]AGB71410.1 putative ankyrin [Rhizobium tropici CIAT 899]MBB4240228.1 ankyrin repeat protein [Rhizobium tropici]MBB5591498.1 ankyrin repeat protein [Rhizobium tropici]MBB6490418.1 ankyrin repeat protein [Rhizobium tropici]NEV11092.1 ankyrin repeat domain-containing protein [Rhizobium tropici]
MTTRSLAVDATLDSLKKQAKSFLKALQAGDASARSRVAPYFADIANVGLQDIQLVLAREFGFSSWTKLKAHLESGDRRHVPPDQLANRFLSLATVSYFANIPADPARFDEALRLLEDNPEIADESIQVAAALGDADRIARWLDRQPQLLDRKGGPHDLTPLMYAAYARVPGRSSLPAAGELVRRGADVNAFFLDAGQYRFTVLTGVFGEGEAGKERQPQHSECEAFARLLLDAGAEANDSQALYNRMFEPDNTCLKLLIEYGLSARDKNNWLVREDGKFVENSQTVFDYQLAWALEHRMGERVRLLVDHGADVHEPVNGRTPYEWARLSGDSKLAAYLIQKGAVAVRLKPEDWAYIQVKAGDIDAEQIKKVFQQMPGGRDLDIAAAMRKAHPAMLHDAAGENDLGAVRRMLALGLDANAMTSRTPLHEAALHGHMEMAKLLIEHGADTTVRDPIFHAPPIGWAEYNGKHEMVEFLKAYPLDIFAAAAFGQIDQLAAILDKHPAQVNMRFGKFRSHGEPTDRDWMTPLGFAIANRRGDAASFLLAQGADRSVRDASGRSYRDLAREAGDEAIISLLRKSGTA